jgi:hypothetical protein
MLDDMKLRNMAAGTRRSYVRSVADFSAFHGRSPDELTLEDVRDYQLHLVARGLKASSICPIVSALGSSDEAVVRVRSVLSFPDRSCWRRSNGITSVRRSGRALQTAQRVPAPANAQRPAPPRRSLR